MSDQGSNYWISRKISRRTAIRGAGVGATGLLGAVLIGCNSDDDGDAPADTSTGSTGGGAAPTSTAGGGAAPTAAGTAAVGAAGSRGQVDIAQSSLDTQPGDPHAGTSGIQEPIRVAANTGLFNLDIDGDVVPAVAESIEAAGDSLSYTVKIRDGITFTNGDPLTGEDVLYSMERTAAIGSGSASWTRRFDRHELVDPMTINVYQTKVEPTAWLTLRALYTVPKKYAEGLDDGEWAEKAFGDQPVGVGPYRLTENRIGISETFEAHDDYFLGTPHVKTVVVHVVPELRTKIAQLETGEVDIVHGVLADQIDQITAIDGGKIVSSFGSGSSELTYFDMMKPDSPFNDVRVRKALPHAINRQEIIDTLYRGQAILQNSLFVKFPATTGYDEDLANNEPFPYDVQTSKQLLDAAGYPDGFETEITTYDTSTTPGTPQMMEAVSNYLSEVGVIAPVRFMEAGQYVGQFRDKALTGMGPISYGGLISDFAQTYESHYLGNTGDETGGPFSYDDWQEGDDQWRAIQAEVDPAKREQMSQQLLRELSRDRVPNLTLLAPHALLGLGPRVADYPRPPAQPYLSHINHIRLEDDA